MTDVFLTFTITTTGSRMGAQPPAAPSRTRLHRRGAPPTASTLCTPSPPCTAGCRASGRPMSTWLSHASRCRLQSRSSCSWALPVYYTIVCWVNSGANITLWRILSYLKYSMLGCKLLQSILKEGIDIWDRGCSCSAGIVARAIGSLVSCEEWAIMHQTDRSATAWKWRFEALWTAGRVCVIVISWKHAGVEQDSGLGAWNWEPAEPQLATWNFQFSVPLIKTAWGWKCSACRSRTHVLIHVSKSLMGTVQSCVGRVLSTATWHKRTVNNSDRVMMMIPHLYPETVKRFSSTCATVW